MLYTEILTPKVELGTFSILSLVEKDPKSPFPDFFIVLQFTNQLKISKSTRVKKEKKLEMLGIYFHVFPFPLFFLPFLEHCAVV